MKIYLSGPITIDPENHVRRFAERALDVKRIGHEPLDPHDIEPFSHEGKPCPPGARTGPDDPHTWPCYLRTDIIEMLRCDALLMLKGWHLSPGANFERDTAMRCSLPIYYSLEEVPRG